jgi:hypothetical protein
MKCILPALLVAVLGFTSISNAALVENGGGLIYDTDRNITWYDYSYMGPFEAGATWDQAVSWASSLTVGGVSGWRLPMSDFCEYENCSGSEMGHLYYIELGLTYETSISPTNQLPFSALQTWENGYWSGTEYPGYPVSTLAMYFDLNNGIQGANDKSGDPWGVGKYALAVHSGNIAAPSLLPGDFDTDGDVDGYDLAALIATPGQLAIAVFAQNFGSSPGLGPLGFGTISGETGYVIMESSTSVPSFHVNQIEFGSGYDKAQLSLLAQRAQLILGDTPGGSSAYSVAFSYEILSRVEGAVLLKAGSDINYSDPSGKRTDYLVSVGGTKLGVRVARAFVYPPGTPYSVSQAQALLTSKLQDIQLSTANVSAEDAWMKQILHVFAYDAQYVEVLQAAYDQIDAPTKGNTIVYITRTDGADAFMYY